MRRYQVRVIGDSLRVEQSGFHVQRHADPRGQVCFLRDYPMPELTRTADRVLEQGLPGLHDIPDNTVVFAIRHRDGVPELIAARDSLGNTPLYATDDESSPVFASDMSSLPSERSTTLNRAAVGEYLLFRYTSGPNTLRLGVSQPLASHAWVKDGQSVRHVPYRDLRNGFSGTGVRLAPQALAACLRDSLARENAFPHLGIMFSGGLDSTYIAAALHRTDLVLYSIGFPGIGAVDLEAAEREAAILRLPLKRVHVDRRGFADRLPAAIRHFGWPIDHPNFVARDILFEQAQADGIDRLLSGDGSDTVFGGAWYVALHKALLLKRWVPSIARFAPPIHHRLRYISHILETPVEDLILFDKTYYPQSVARAFAQDAGDFAEHLRAQLRPVAGWDPLDQAFYIAHLTTLSIYPSAQRGMAWYWDDDVGYPFLNERVVRLAQSVAGRAKVRGFVAKRIFLPVAAAAVSRQTMARRKYGLPVPFEDFIFGPGGMFRYQDLLRERDTATAEVISQCRVVELLDRLSARKHTPDDLQLYWVILNLEIWARQALRGEIIA